MKRLFGGYEITKFMGHPLMDYVKITNFLNLIEAPMSLNNKKVNGYCLTEKQARLVKDTLEELKRKLQEK